MRKYPFLPVILVNTVFYWNIQRHIRILLPLLNLRKNGHARDGEKLFSGLSRHHLQEPGYIMRYRHAPVYLMQTKWPWNMTMQRQISRTIRNPILSAEKMPKSRLI